MIIRFYRQSRAFTNVDEDDLFSILDRTAKEDGALNKTLNVKDLFSSWSRQAGFPLLIVQRNYENGSITLSQQRYLADRFSPLINATTRWIPYNFATAKSPWFNSTKADGWLPQHQNAILIEPSAEHNWSSTDWVLFNKKLTGFYRVMYDIRNWKLLIAELNSGPNNKIHPLSRAQLLEDLADFVETGRLPHDLLFEMVKYLKHETEFAPWVAGSRAILYLKKSLVSTKNYEKYQRTATSIIDSAEQNIAMKIAFYGEQLSKDAHAIVVNLACDFGCKSCSNSRSGKLEITMSKEAIHTLSHGNFRRKIPRKLSMNHLFWSFDHYLVTA